MSTIYIRFGVSARDLEAAPMLEPQGDAYVKAGREPESAPTLGRSPLLEPQGAAQLGELESAPTLERAPLLERLLARATLSIGWEGWREEAFRAIASAETPMPPIGAAALHAAGLAQHGTGPEHGASPEHAAGPEHGAWACVATPVHLSAGMSNVTMSARGILEVDHEAARALANDFTKVFGNAQMRLVVGASGLLLGLFERPLEVVTHDPDGVEGRDVFGFQPQGPDADRLRRLMSEMEMWLFDHAVNRDRAAHSLPAITSLWLWGGGPVPSSMPALHGWTAGRDPLFAAFGNRTEFPRQAGAGVVVCSERVGSVEWLALEQRWLEPAWSNLRSGRIDRIVLSVGNRRFAVRKGFGRWWRRARPWWDTLGTAENTGDLP